MVTNGEPEDVKLVDSDGAREIIGAGGQVRRDDRYSVDYRYIVVTDPRAR